MANDKLIKLKIVLDDKGVPVKLESLEKGIKDIDLTTKNAEGSVKRLNAEISNIGLKGGALKSIKVTQSQYSKLARTQNQLKDSTKSATAAIKGTELAIRQEIIALKQEQAAKATTNQSWLEYRLKIQQAEKELQDLTATQSKFTSSAKTLRTSTKNLSSGMTTLKSNTGLASGAALELGRVISDAPYGIRGMANNVSQLASQLFFLAGQQDLSAKATKSSTVATNQSTVAKGVNATATSAMATTEVAATATTYGLSGALKAMWASLMGPLGILLAIQAVISAIDYFYGSTSKAKEGVDDLSKSLNTLGGKTFLMNQYYNVLNKVNSSEQERKVAIQELEKLIPSLKNKDIDYREELDKVRASIDSYVLSQASRIEIDKLVEQNSELLTKRATIRRINEIKDEKKRTEEIRSFLKKQGEDTFFSGLTSSTMKEDDREDSGYSPFGGMPKVRKRIEKNLKELTPLFNQQIKEINAKAKPILDRINDLRKGIELVTDDDTKVKPLDFIDPYVADTIKPKISKPIPLKGEIVELGNLGFEGRLKEFQEYADKAKEILGSINDFVSAEFEREMTIEQNKTNAKNEQLNARLRNEKLSEEKRKEILNQIAINDENLRKKQEVIAKKKFKAEKAFNISMALINTFSAATGALRDTKGNPLARILGMTAIITAGLAQVATISRQKYQTTSSASSSSAVTSTGGSSTSSAEREMNFNIVGNSNSTQLVDAIQSKFDQPLKAYVVSREITSSQALESNIVETASL